MDAAEWWALLFCLITTVLHLLSALLAAVRCRTFWRAPQAQVPSQPVSILRPVRGVDPYDPVTLGSGFKLDHPDYELIFCCADGNDPAVALVNDLMRANPHVRARLLIGDDERTSNPKLNNLVKGWDSARHSWIAMADSNVLMPRDYIQRLMAGWRPDTGVVCSPPIGSHARGFWAELECAFLNTYQGRWQLAADTVGLGFAQGKSMLWRREVLAREGGVLALAGEIAEDAAATKVVRRQGLRVRLVDRPFLQPLGSRTARQVWDRQMRWAILRRATFPVMFTPELLSTSVWTLLAAAYAADAVEVAPEIAVIAAAAVWYGSEAVLARAAGWHMTFISPLAWIARDILLPALWIKAWLGDNFVWRDNEMALSPAAPLTDRHVGSHS
jgi:ceramide glucosyltransferase